MTYRLSDEDREALMPALWTETARARMLAQVEALVSREVAAAVAEVERERRDHSFAQAGYASATARLEAAEAKVAAVEALIREGIEAFRFTREYVEPTVLLPEIEGWSWFDWCQSARAALGEARP